MRTQVQSLASLSGLRIWHCHELCCGSQTQLRSVTAVAQAGGYSSNSAPSLGTSICHECSPKKDKKKKKKKKKKKAKEQTNKKVDVMDNWITEVFTILRGILQI